MTLSHFAAKMPDMTTPFRPKWDIDDVLALISLFHALKLDGEWVELFPDAIMRDEVTHAMDWFEQRWDRYNAIQTVNRDWQLRKPVKAEKSDESVVDAVEELRRVIQPPSDD